MVFIALADFLAMPRRMSDAEDGIPKKRIAPNGNKLPNPIKEGEVFTDITGSRWKLGRSVGVGGFGEIYLGKYNTHFTL